MNLVLTKNFYSWMRTVLLGCSTSISATTSSTNGLNANGTSLIEPMMDVTGTERTSLTFVSSYCGQNATLNYWYTGQDWGTNFQIGNNSTPATEDDYSLSGGYVLGTDYSVIHRAVSNAQTVNGKGVLTFNVTFTATNDIVIGEIGMFKRMQINSNAAEQFLLGRIALDTPIELGAGESATFQVSIEI